MATTTPAANRGFIQELTAGVLAGKQVSRAAAARIASLQRQADILLLMAHANLLREHFHGSTIDLCAIINAKSGRCSEDCRFCAQSAHYTTTAPVHPLMRARDITRAARQARKSGARRFSIVVSGKGLESPREFGSVCRSVTGVAGIQGLGACASLGILTGEQFGRLRACGLRRYHHNIETAGSFFGRICTTHSFADRIRTVRLAAEAGLETCCGAILGMGETRRHWVELAYTLRDLNVDCVPLNFLNPIPQTPLAHRPLLEPLEALKAVALFRFVMPRTEIRVCGGREINLRGMQPLVYIAGANGTMIGNYLTTTGRSAVEDLQEIRDIGLKTGKKE